MVVPDAAAARPAGHSAQVELAFCPIASELFPAAHSVQKFAPINALYMPCGHGMQCAEVLTAITFEPKCPAPQSEPA